MPAAGTVRVIRPGSGYSSLRSISRWIVQSLPEISLRAISSWTPTRSGTVYDFVRTSAQPATASAPSASTSSRTPTATLKPAAARPLVVEHDRARDLAHLRAAARAGRAAGVTADRLGGPDRHHHRRLDRWRCRGRRRALVGRRRGRRLVGDVGQHDQRLGRLAAHVRLGRHRLGRFWFDRDDHGAWWHRRFGPFVPPVGSSGWRAGVDVNSPVAISGIGSGRGSLEAAWTSPRPNSAAVEPILAVGTSGALEHRGERAEVGRHRHQLADAQRQRRVRRVAGEGDRAVTASINDSDSAYTSVLASISMPSACSGEA